MIVTGFAYDAPPMRVRFGFVVASPYANPVPVTRGGVVRPLQAARAGEPPAAG